MRQVPGRAPLLAALSFVLLSACSHGAATPPASSATTSKQAAGAVVSVTGKAHISGTLDALAGAATLTDPLSTPLTITVAEAGRGGFEIAHAIVNGHDSSIVWSGGRPLPVTGACRLDVGEAAVDINPSGAVFSLDDGVRALTAGDCAFGSSVAVGSGGLAESVDSVRFRLAQDAPFKPTGGTRVSVTPARHYEGHHGTASVSGALKVETDRGESETATKVSLGNGTWIADVTAAPDGLHVEAQFDGDLTIQR